MFYDSKTGGIGKGRGVEVGEADCLRDSGQKTGQLDGRTQVQTSSQL